jgi:dienelactone hydrolase
MAYYSSLEHLWHLYDRCKREYAFAATTIEEFEQWKLRTRNRLCEITGMDLCEKVELTPIQVSSVQEQGYIREYWLIQTEPEITMPFYLLKPISNGNGAAVIVPHGHGGGKEGTIADMDNPGVLSHKQWFKDTVFAKQLVQQGYVVACPDARGAGERREFIQQGDTAAAWSSNSHRELLQVGIGFGQSPIGWFVWDLMRLIDFLQTQPGIDKDRIGCAGMSGGGQQTIWLAALDDRIKVAVTSGYFYGMKESLLKLPNNCACNFIPFMWKTADIGDLGALIAPRAFLIESGQRDPLNGAPGLDNVYPQVETTKKAFTLLDAENKLFHSVHSGAHEWNGKDVIPFLEKWL